MTLVTRLTRPVSPKCQSRTLAPIAVGVLYHASADAQPDRRRAHAMSAGGGCHEQPIMRGE